jgi:hypothetical protein
MASISVAYRPQVKIDRSPLLIPVRTFVHTFMMSN